MINGIKQYLDRLRSSGLRPTKQRLAICKVLFDRKETFHFTIENLKKKIDKSVKNKISLATVYNTVHAFKKNGYLRELSLQSNKTFFDTNSSIHHHFYDKDTGDLIDIKNEDILLSKLPLAPKGKKIKEIQVTLNLENNNHNKKKIAP
ncbi:MAG: Fur family transcriptional regulator, iron response regulator [Pelagibacterales bacterium]|nr:Fur family transcriptional regulator, iron response regulator [Pelagibacterales bacterium]